MRKKLNEPTSVDKIAALKEGDYIFTNKYGKCKVEFIDRKGIQVNPGVYVRDDYNAPHFIYAKDIVWEE